MNSFDRALGLACGRTDQQMMQAEQHRAALQSVQLQALQTGLLAQMSNSLGAIHAEVAQARQMQAEALAIQQELLGRERLQARLEELIYQTEKLVVECRRPDSDLPPSSRYYLLGGVLQQVEQDGIGTAVIRGRDNKAAFEKVIGEAGVLHKRLEADSDVQDALRWAKKADQERQRRLGSLRAEADTLREEIAAVRVGKKSVTMKQVFDGFVRDGKVPYPKSKGQWVAVVAVALIFNVMLIPVAGIAVAVLLVIVSVETHKRNAGLAADTDRAAEPLERKLKALEDQIGLT
jgi:hypothetical protein